MLRIKHPLSIVATRSKSLQSFVHLRCATSSSSRVGVGSDGRVQCFINNLFVDINSNSADVADQVINPATQSILAQTPNTSTEQIDQAVAAAKHAFADWKQTPTTTRMKLLAKLESALRQEIDAIADVLTEEQGKTLKDSQADVARGLDSVGNLMAAPNLLTGSSYPNVYRGVDVYSQREPLGVCVGVTPFNFPAMIGLWLFPAALVAGNTFIWKPSPKVPLTAMRIAQIASDVGIPPGVLNVVHGGKPAVERLCSHPDISAISFVGGNAGGRFIYEMAGKHGKRAQCNMGAKNHAVVCEDAEPDKALKAVCNAAFGASGQRCMAISVAILVGKAAGWEAKLADVAKQFRVGAGVDASSDLGPMISAAAKKKATEVCRESVQNFGAKFLVDGTDTKVKDFPLGNFFGPTVITDVTTNTPAYQVELFAPALCLIKVPTLDDAIKLINMNPYGNGCALFTRDEKLVRKFVSEVEVGQVGVNLPIPLPPPMFSFTGWKDSFAGDATVGGRAGLMFFTREKNVLRRWN